MHIIHSLLAILTHLSPIQVQKMSFNVLFKNVLESNLYEDIACSATNANAQTDTMFKFMNILF